MRFQTPSKDIYLKGSQTLLFLEIFTTRKQCTNFRAILGEIYVQPYPIASYETVSGTSWAKTC